MPVDVLERPLERVEVLLASRVQPIPSRYEIRHGLGFHLDKSVIPSAAIGNFATTIGSQMTEEGVPHLMGQGHERGRSVMASVHSDSIGSFAGECEILR